MQWLWELGAKFATGSLNAILGTVGKTITDLHVDNTTRQKNENDAGNQLATTIIASSTEAGRTRADVQKSQGGWGPFGLAGFVIAMSFAFHTSLLVLDSCGWHLHFVMIGYVVPWLEWHPHILGSWHIAALPPPFDATEHEILKALFYVGPPSAAIAIAAKAFRR